MDLLAAARTVTHVTSGARIAWANGLLSADECRAHVGAAVELLFRGVANHEGLPRRDPSE